jgi:hypothetical protein
MVHFWYTAFVIFRGIGGTFHNMSHLIAATNFFLTGWWTVDVLLAWFASPEKRWVRVERAAAHAFIFLVFVITELFLRPTFVRYLGIALVACVAVSVLVRLSGPAYGAVADGTRTE